MSVVFDKEREKERTAYSTKSTFRSGSLSSRAKIYKPGMIRSMSNTGASIPTKTVTKIIEVPMERAFGQTSARFFYKKDEENTDTPGPADYSSYRPHLWKDNKQSNSRKGFGLLTSKVFRQSKTRDLYNTGPGPGTYEAKIAQDLGHERQLGLAQRRANLLKKKQQIAKNKRNLPNSVQNKRDYTLRNVGPGYYSPSTCLLPPPSGLGSCGFRSKAPRQTLASQSARDTPSCCHYDADRGNGLFNKPTSVKGLSSFSGSVVNRDVKHTDYKKMRELLVGGALEIGGKGINDRNELQTNHKIPGPGEYNVDEGFHNLKDHHISTTKAPMAASSPLKPSFLISSLTPCPGAYSLPSQFSSTRYMAYNSAFMSGSNREGIKIRDKKDETIWKPCNMEGLEGQRKVFNRNKNKQWI